MQFGIRTLLELTFVVAVVLAFVYWRNPAPPPSEATGRYQLHIDPTEFDRRLVFDTQTGEAWGCDPSSIKWYKIQPPPLAGPKK